MATPMFTGVWTALVTPFDDDDAVDIDALRALVDDQIEMGIDGLVACGTTGEASTLSAEEKVLVVKTMHQHAAGRVPVVAGAGSNNTRVACDLQKQMRELGVEGTLQVTPWYNKPTQEGLIAHFSAIIDAADIPTILYNVPARCSIDMQAETVAHLAKKHPAIVAVKEATGSLPRAQDILCRTHDVRDDFSVLSGEDGVILGLLGIGGHGVISVISHLCAGDLRAMFDAFAAGEMQKAQALSRKVSPLQPPLFFRSNPVPTKAALVMTRMKGMMKEHVRLPLVGLNDDDTTQLGEMLNAAGYGAAA